MEKGFKRKNREKISRRKFLGLLLAGISGLITYKLIHKENKEEESDKERKLEEILKEINEYLKEIENNNQKIEFEDKEFEKYLKEHTKSYPSKAYLLEDSNLALDTLWEEKNDFLEKNKKEGSILKFRELKLNKLEIFENSPKGYIPDLKTFKKYIEYCISEIFLTFDWNKVFQNEKSGFSENKINLFRKVFLNEDFLEFFVNIIIALILNEICYISEDSEKNKKLLEFLLNNHGLLFIINIPSLYDERLSLGPFQLTDLVVNPDKEKFYPINFMNQFINEFPQNIKEKYELPNYILPESLENFGIRDHFKGEILLLLYYLIFELFKDLDLSLLEFAFEDRDWLYYQISYYLAGCHHLPKITQNLFKDFFNKENIIKKKSFVDFVKEKGNNNDLVIYLERFRDNLKGVG